MKLRREDVYLPAMKREWNGRFLLDSASCPTILCPRVVVAWCWKTVSGIWGPDLLPLATTVSRHSYILQLKYSWLRNTLHSNKRILSLLFLFRDLNLQVMCAGGFPKVWIISGDYTWQAVCLLECQEFAQRIRILPIHCVQKTYLLITLQSEKWDSTLEYRDNVSYLYHSSLAMALGCLWRTFLISTTIESDTIWSSA